MDCIFKTACSKIIRKYSSEECRWKRAVCIHCYYVVYLNQIMIIQRRDWGGSCPESLWITNANCLEMSPWTQTSVRQISYINRENIRYKTFHSFLLCISILNICMLQQIWCSAFHRVITYLCFFIPKESVNSSLATLSKCSIKLYHMN